MSLGAEPEAFAFRERGRGNPPIVLLHGFTGSSLTWGGRITEGLARARRVIAVDLPGHGATPVLSGLPPVRSPWERLLDGLDRTMEAADAAHADLVGYSMGGRIALGLAATFPERVRRLVLESASPGLEDLASRRARQHEDELRAQCIESEGVEPFVDTWMSLPLFDTQAALPLRLREEARANRIQNSPEGLAAALREFGTGAQPSLWEDLGRMDLPTLLLTGALDSKFEAVAHAMIRQLPHARSVSVPGAGHAVHLEAPEEWLAAVTAFLS